MPLSQIRSIAQSADGYLWLGAPQEGLFRFDGIRFSAPGDSLASPSALPDIKDVTALCASNDGTLWVGTTSGLWNFKGKESDHFTTGQGLSHNTVSAIHESPDHDLWVGTARGLNRIRGHSIKVYPMADVGLPQPINVVRCDQTGGVWIGTRDGVLCRLVNDRLTVLPRERSVGGDEINAILEGRDGSMWIAIWNGGLTRLKEGAIEVHGPKDGRGQTEILALAEDRWGSIWVGTRRGLFVLPGETAGGGPIEFVADGSVHSLSRDREGSIWAGTLSGLQQYKDWRLPVYSEHDGLRDRNVASVFPAKGGGVWVGMNGGGLARFRDGKVVATYGVAEGLPSDDVTSVCESRDGTVWIGNWGEGLHRLRDNKITPVPVGDHLKSGIVRSVYEDRSGDIWVGTWGDGLLRFHGDVLTAYRARDGLADDQVRVIEEDRAGNLWIATNAGLSRFRDGQFQTYRRRDGLSEDSIYALRADDAGSVWIGTGGGGLNRLRDGRVTSYTTREGLPCDTICEILGDGQGNLWMSSLRGIFRVHKDELDAIDRAKKQLISLSSYDMADGMISAQCNRGTQPSGCRTADGRLWFATINGIVMLDPTALPINTVEPTVILEQVLCDDSPMGASAFLELPAARQEIVLRFTATCLLASEKVRFRYKLDRYTDWVEAAHGREVRFSNLPPGVFKFIVAARNGDGIWGQSTELLRLAIKPPLLMRPSFLLGYVILMLGAGVVAYRLWMARVRARERELVFLVESCTADARAAQTAAEQANRTKNRFLAVLSHELRTPLTPVLLSVGCLLDDEISPEAREQLEMIRRNVELEARLVDDLLDVSRIECDRFKLNTEIVDVHDAIGRAAEICREDVRTSGLRVVFDLGAESHHARADQARLIQVFWNLIRNAVKFASPDGTLVIRTYNDDNDTALDSSAGLVVAFLDTGIGIEPEMLEKIFEPFEQGSVELNERRGGLGLGLAISRAVAEAHGGRLSASSAGPKQGSTFRLELVACPAPETAAELAPRLDLVRERPEYLRVLLVEDNMDTLRYLGVVLKRQGHQVTPASSLALARQAAHGAEFDMLISDIELPDGTGLELMRELKPTGLIGIALSGYGSEDDIRNSRAAGFSLHIVKPVLAHVIADAVSRLATTEMTAELSQLGDKTASDRADRQPRGTLEARS